MREKKKLPTTLSFSAEGGREYSSSTSSSGSISSSNSSNSIAPPHGSAELSKGDYCEVCHQITARMAAFHYLKTKYVCFVFAVLSFTIILVLLARSYLEPNRDFYVRIARIDVLEVKGTACSGFSTIETGSPSRNTNLVTFPMAQDDGCYHGDVAGRPTTRPACTCSCPVNRTSILDGSRALLACIPTQQTTSRYASHCCCVN